MSSVQPAAAAAPAQPAARAIGNPELARRQVELTRQLAQLQWDLGGLVYEMAIRDHFRLDLVVRQAAELQAVDAELGAVERMLRMEQAGAAGSCPKCGALYPRGAVFCWQCGSDLMERSQVGGEAARPAEQTGEAAQPAQEGAHAAPSAQPSPGHAPTADTAYLAGTRPPGADPWEGTPPGSAPDAAPGRGDAS
jgi:hypothetical protein